MSEVEYAPRALSDIKRLTDFLTETDPTAAQRTLDIISGALKTLAAHPLIGRPVQAGLHELVISRGRTGYLALYEYQEELDRVVVLAVRHQREGGFTS